MMKFADRFKVFATLSAGPLGAITLAAADSGARTLLQVITDGANDPAAFKVGDSGVPLMVQGSGGVWERAYFTITSNTVITRESTISSSNGGGAATFPAGVVTVFSDPPANWMSKLVTTDDAVDIGGLTLGSPVMTGLLIQYNPATGKTEAVKVSDLMALGGGTPIQQITVGTIASQVAGTQFSVTGTYANGTPTALEWSINGSSYNPATATISGGTYTITGVTVPSANSSQTVLVRDATTKVGGTSSAFVVNAAEAITVDTPASQVVNAAFNVTGWYTNGTPAALDYRFSDDAAGVWTQAPTGGTTVINAGAFQISVTATSTSAGRTVSVRDRNNTSAMGTSGSFVVNATAPTTAPGQVTGLTAGTPTDTTQPLSWTAVSGADSYIVEKSISGANSWSTVATGVTGTSYTVPGLTQSTAYDYRVSAKNTVGTGTASGIVTKSTVATSAAQTIGVTTPATATAYRAYTLSGTWTGTQPTALEYRTTDNGGTPSAWASLSGATINANGTWSASVTPTTYAASRIMSVRDATTQVAGSSNAYQVLSMAQAYMLTSANSAGITPTTFSLTAASPDYYGVPGTVRVNVRDAGGVAANPAHVKFVFGLYYDAQGNPAPCPITNFNSSGMAQGVNGTTNAGGHNNGFATASLLNAGSLPGTMVASGSFYFWVGSVTSGATVYSKLWVVFADGSYAAYKNGGADPIMLTATVP